MEYITHSPEETEALGAEYAKSLKAGDVVAFSGDLGARQDRIHARCAARTRLRGSRHQPDLCHCKRIRNADGQGRALRPVPHSRQRSVFEVGFDEYLDGSRIVLIEWSENAADVLPEAYKTVHIAYGDADNDRRITIGEVTV